MNKIQPSILKENFQQPMYQHFIEFVNLKIKFVKSPTTQQFICLNYSILNCKKVIQILIPTTQNSKQETLQLTKRFAINFLPYLALNQENKQNISSLKLQLLKLLNNQKYSSNLQILLSLDQQPKRNKFITSGFQIQKKPQTNLFKKKKLKIIDLRKIFKYLSPGIKIRKKQVQVNKWLFLSFLPEINLKDFPHIKCFQFCFIIYYSKHGNIEIGITPKNTIIEYPNSCSAKRLSYHVRNGQIYDGQKIISGTSTMSQNYHSWRQNPISDSSFQSIEEPIKIKLVVCRNTTIAPIAQQQFLQKYQYTDYNIQWRTQEKLLAKSKMTKELYENGFRLCAGLFHTNDCISIGYDNTINENHENQMMNEDIESQVDSDDQIKPSEQNIQMVQD